MKKLPVYFFIWTLFLSAILFAEETVELSPYYTYSADSIHHLKGLNSEETIDIDALAKWDEIADALIEKYPLSDGDDLRVITYLYTAQRDFGALTLRLTGRLNGNLDKVSSKILQLFFLKYHPPEDLSDDPYSNALSQVILEKYRKRFAEEQKRYKDSYVPHTNNTWEGDHPYYGIAIASFMPWRLKTANQFSPTPPDSDNKPFWDKQVEIVKEQVEQITPKKINAVYWWAGLSGPKSGNWLYIAEKAMDKKNTPIKKRLMVRAVLAEGMLDSLIAAFDAKYAFCLKRPHMLDPDIEPLVAAPNHPTYPSGHSTVSACAAEILSYYFPEDKNTWNQLAIQAGYSRIWGGIHFPIDHTAGWNLGKQVTDKELQN